MRRDDLYLNDIIESTDHIAEFIAGVDFAAFQKSEMMRSAVVQKLAIVGRQRHGCPRKRGIVIQRSHGPRSSLFETSLFTPTSALTGMRCGGPQGIVALYSGLRSLGSSRENPAERESRVGRGGFTDERKRFWIISCEPKSHLRNRKFRMLRPV